MSYDFLQPIPLLFFGNAVFSFTIAIYVTSFRTTNVARGVVGVLVGAGIWSLADGVRASATTADLVLFWNSFSYVGAAFTPPAAVLFVAAYTDSNEWLRPRRFGSIVAISVIMVPIALTNVGDLWRTGAVVRPESSPPVITDEVFGIAHVLWIAYVLVGIVPLLYVLLYRAYRRVESELFRRQILFTTLAVSAPSVGSALFVVGLTPVDLTPFGFTLFAVAVTVAIVRYQVLDIVPIARDTVVENVDAGVVVLDYDDRIVDANEHAKRLMGVDNGLIGTGILDVIGDDDSVRNLVQRATDETTTVSIDLGEETRHYHANFSPIHDERGRQRGRVLIFNDITDQVNRQAQLEAQNERLDQFASVVSHDLRNPLNVASLQLERGLETGDETAFESVSESLDRMDRMIEQLLTLARVETAPEDAEQLYLDNIVDRAWATTATENGTLAVDGSLGTVHGHPELVVELFENLFRNAIEHNDESLQITVSPLEDASGFAVTDDGVGIPPEDREQIFDHGFTTDRENTGFGLSIVEDIVDAHGWEIAVTDSAAGGARFEIRTGEGLTVADDGQDDSLT